MEPANTPPSSPDWIGVGVAIPFSGAVVVGGGGGEGCPLKMPTHAYMLAQSDAHVGLMEGFQV
jgi:hypothetical protein